MKQRSEQEIREFLQGIIPEDYPDANEIQDLRIEISPDGEGWKITIEKMYSYVNLTFALLTKISEFFATLNINDSRWSLAGCDTCDYGSSYTIELTVQP